jgi:Set1/Ash2 histone methyltransferase complex subunit ASH2
MTSESARKGGKKCNGNAKYEESSDDEAERFSCYAQVVIPIEEERARRSSNRAEKLHVRWSTVDKEEAVKLSDDALTASCHCGYRALRATHGVSHGSWFFELEIGGVAKAGEGVAQEGHCRVGWAMDRVAYEDLEAPIGYSPDMDDPSPPSSEDEAGEDGAAANAHERPARRPHYGMSFAYGSKTGAVYTRSRRMDYGEVYSTGDVIGCLIELTRCPPPPFEPKMLNEGSRFHCPIWVHYWVQKKLQRSPRARISFFKNGVFQGHAFEDIWLGTYYPAASFYYGGSARANFGPEFRYPPEMAPGAGGQGGADYRPMSDAWMEMQVRECGVIGGWC